MKISLAGAAALAFLAAAPVLAQEATQPPKATPQEAESPAPPPGIPGHYDPVTRTFKPQSAPQAEPVRYIMSGDIVTNFQFLRSSPLDWPTIGCSYEIRYEPTGPIVYGVNIRKGSQQVDPARTPRLAIPYRVSVLTAEPSPKFRLLERCTGYDINGVGHSLSSEEVIVLRAGRFDIAGPVTFP